MTDEQRDRIRERAVRGCVLVLAIFGLVAVMLAFYPSVEVYRDSNDCMGQALGNLFSWHGHRPCDSHWVLVSTTTPVEPIGFTAYLAILLAPGMLMWKQRNPWLALLWMPWAIISTGVMLVATFELDLFSRTREVPTLLAHVFTGTTAALVGALIVIVPLGCLALGLATRKPRPPAPVFPTARVVIR